MGPKIMLVLGDVKFVPAVANYTGFVNETTVLRLSGSDIHSWKGPHLPATRQQSVDGNNIAQTHQNWERQYPCHLWGESKEQNSAQLTAAV